MRRRERDVRDQPVRRIPLPETDNAIVRHREGQNTVIHSYIGIEETVIDPVVVYGSKCVKEDPSAVHSMCIL